jgi:hypothetical protein
MVEVIDFGQAAASMGRFRCTEPVQSSADFDVLDCMYCSAPVAASQILPGPVAVYRCACKKTFRVVEDGTVMRGMSGGAF